MKLIVVTGGAGFIGSNLIKSLNDDGRHDIIAVDDLSDGRKFSNLAQCTIHDYLDKHEFIDQIRNDTQLINTIELVFHQGACTDTMEWDGKYMMENNYSYSKNILEFCSGKGIPFIYASSAAVYGAGNSFTEKKENELPVNVYGYSKLLFDEYVRRCLAKATSQIAGLRYFNVYGPGEQHKNAMASIASQLNDQLKMTGKVKLFSGSDGYADGEQRRDFIYITDVISINKWFMDNRSVSGIFNVGTGKCRSFNNVAKLVIDWHGKGEIEYIEFPAKLIGTYQSFTEADIGALNNAGYNKKFLSLEEGMKQYLDWLNR